MRHLVSFHVIDMPWQYKIMLNTNDSMTSHINTRSSYDVSLEKIVHFDHQYPKHIMPSYEGINVNRGGSDNFSPYFINLPPFTPTIHQFPPKLVVIYI